MEKKDPYLIIYDCEIVKAIPPNWLGWCLASGWGGVRRMRWRRNRIMSRWMLDDIRSSHMKPDVKWSLDWCGSQAHRILRGLRSNAIKL